MPHLAFVLLLPAFLQVAGAEQVEAVELLQRRLLLSSATPEPFVLEDALPMTWVHIPKCGSSFLNTLVHMKDFCPGIQVNTPVDQDTFGGYEYLFNFIAQCSSLCDTTMLYCPKVPHECLGEDWEAGKGTFVGMFRQPEQRILSMYYDIQHEFHMYGPHSRLEEAAVQAGLIEPRPRPPMAEFAHLFGGTMAYQLIAHGATADSEYPPRSLGNPWDLPNRTLDMAEEAARRVKEGFAFVGITEQWDLSVCLFHAMFGGPCRSLEFENTRPGNGNKSAEDLYDTTPLEGFIDHVDRVVYQEALRIFWHNLQKYNVSFETCQRTCFEPASL
mmetsp:Transcript_44281/g.99146  ORF Transcript_44281/g.99146 Transcript_44281/m.99146 type:complete len:329 (-) Transcript_44281:42-1028(-)